MPKIKIKVINQSAHALPEYATTGSSGMDLRAHLPQPVVLRPLERKLIGTGLFLEIPSGFEGQVRSRSGLAVKQGVSCLNAPGTVDADYRGEIMVILINLSEKEQVIQPGERIAQLVLAKVEKIKWHPVKKIAVTKRNAGGFGHTGKS